MRKLKTSHKLAAAMTAGMMLGASDAHAQAVNATNLTANLVGSSTAFTDLMSLLGYVGGTGFALAGIYKLKQHVDNPGQTPMKDGMMRLAAGGALLSLPFIVNVMQGSVADDAANATTSISKMVTFQ